MNSNWFTRQIPLCRSDENIEPFFIIGSGRSGNTLIRRLIICNSLAYIPPETYVLGDVINSFIKNRHLSWHDVVILVLGQFEYCPEFKEFPVSNLREFLPHALNLDVEKRSLAGLLDMLYCHFGESANIDFLRWGDKTPYNTFALDHLHRTFPNAKFIYMLRDGCDVVSSYVKAELYPTLEAAADRWVMSNRLALKFMRKNLDNVLRIKYEQLTSEPNKNIDKVLTFLQIPRSINSDDNELMTKMGDIYSIEHLKRVTMPIDTTSIGKGRSELTSLQKAMLAPIMDKMLLQMGYDSCLK